MKILLRRLKVKRENETAAVRLVAETLDRKTTYIIRSKNDAGMAADAIRTEKERMEDVHRRLKLILKSGLASESIH